MAEDIGHNDQYGLRHVSLDQLRVDLPGAGSARQRGRQRSRRQALGAASGVGAVAAIIVVASTVAPGRQNGTVRPGVTTGASSSPTTTTPAPVTTSVATPPSLTVTGVPPSPAVPPALVSTTTPTVAAVSTTPPPSNPATSSAPTVTRPPGLVDAVNGFGAAKAILSTATGSCLQVDLRQLLVGAAADAWEAAHPTQAMRLGNLAVIADPDGTVLHCIPIAPKAQITLIADPPPGTIVAKAGTLALLGDLLAQAQSHKPSPAGYYWLNEVYYQWHLDSAGAMDRINAYYIP
jgi:hypothetical protein